MYSKAYYIIGKMVKQEREKLGITQINLARDLGYGSSQFISNLERGVSNIPYESLGKICLILQIREERVLRILEKEYSEKIRNEFNKGKSNFLGKADKRAA